MQRGKTDIPEKKRKTAKVCGVSQVGGKIEVLWRKGSVEKMRFD